MTLVCSCCRTCGKLFKSHIKLVYCEQHKYIDMEQFSIVRDFVLMHPICNCIDVYRVTGIDIKELLRYIDEGMLLTIDDKIYYRET